MASSSSPTVSNRMGSQGQVNGSNMGVNGTNINLQDPGSLDPSSLNPYAAYYTGHLQDLNQQVQQSMPGSDWYSNMEHTQEGRATSALGNQYAAMGLSGSSAEMGGMNQAIQQNQMAWVNRQQGDAMKSAQMQMGLDQAGYNDTRGIQGGYGNFQDAYAQDQLGLLGLQQQQQSANNGQTSQMVSSGMGALAMAAMMA